MLRRIRLSAIGVTLAVSSLNVLANSDPLSGVVATPGGAGLGAAVRSERSLYRGAGTRYDVVPLYLYEGKHAYLHASRVGLHVDSGPRHRFDVFLSHRFEGSPSDRIPTSLAGMTRREPGLDAGASYEYRSAWGVTYVEALKGITDAVDGTELRLGYHHDLKAGRLTIRPHVMLAARDSRLNNYYYGVDPGEATAARAAYQPGGGVNLQVGLYGTYAITERFRLLGGLSTTRWPHSVGESPIVTSRYQHAAMLGLMYDFSPETRAWPESRPLLVRIGAGRASDCDVAKIVRTVCTSLDTQDQTRVALAELGRPFIENLNGWPLDVVGYVGLLQHQERGVQSDFWQVNAYMKGLWRGFPWSDRVMTRLGLGIGVSYAHGIPMLEQRDEGQGGRNTSRLLNYLDPTLDFSVGDLLGVRALKRTFVGVGVSHRSGVFGSSQLLGNVRGGSNYVYGYLEWEM